MSSVVARTQRGPTGRSVSRLALSAVVLALVAVTLTGCNERIGSRCSGSARSTSGVYNIKCVSGRWRIVSRIATPPPAPPQSFTLTGIGSSVQQVSIRPDTKYVVEATYQATTTWDSFSVVSYDSKLGRNGRVLYNWDGNYHGTVLLNVYDTDVGSIGVEATGPWRLDVRPLSGNVPAGPGPFYGTGPSVIEYKGPTRVFVFSHSGESNFIAHAYTLGGYTPLVNEIGVYSGVRVLPGNSLVEIDADGPWMIG